MVRDEPVPFSLQSIRSRPLTFPDLRRAQGLYKAQIPMTSIYGLHTLPPELVAHILTLAAPITDQEDPVAQRRRWRNLNSISLVNSSWREVAQKLLMGDGKVRIYHSKELRPLLELVVGPRGGGGITRHIRSLDLTLWGESLADEIVKLLKECGEGLEELVLEHADRVRFELVVTPNLRSFSARQCTFISSAPFSSSPYPARVVYHHLRDLDLRFNSFTRDSLPIHSDSLPSLSHLMFQTGSQDQSMKTVRAFLQAAAARLKSLSLDQGAWGLYADPSNGTPLSPNLTTLGLYWDAANLSIVGSSLLLPPPPASVNSRSSSNFSPPPYIHLSLYPSAIAPLLSTFSSLFQQASKNDLWTWRNVEHFRFEQTFRQLDLESDIPSSDEDSEVELDEGRRERAEARESEDPNQKLLRKFVELPTSVGIQCSIDGSEERGTKERGFGTSWWRYVREVEKGEVSNHTVKKGK